MVESTSFALRDIQTTEAFLSTQGISFKVSFFMKQLLVVDNKTRASDDNPWNARKS